MGGGKVNGVLMVWKAKSRRAEAEVLQNEDGGAGCKGRAGNGLRKKFLGEGRLKPESETEAGGEERLFSEVV